MLGLVGDIYDAALDPNLWPVVLARIGDAVGGPHVLFGVYDQASGLSNLLSPRIDPDLMASLLTWAPYNPLLPLGIGQPPGKVFSIGDFITKDEFSASAFANEWWYAAGFDFEPLTTNLLVDHNATGILTSHHSQKHAPFDSHQRRLFAALAQHLVRAVALQRRVHHLQISQHHALAALDRLQQGFMLVDAGARPLYVNSAGENLLDGRDSVRLEGGRLSASQADDARELQTLIARCDEGNPERIGGEMKLRRAFGRLPLHVLVTPLRPRSDIAAIPWAVNWHPSATVLITDPEVEVRSRIDELRTRFGLTRAEATFALEIIKGDGRKATADRLGITDGTARGHLSRIFDKTGVSRQAELVRLLLQR
ncbi:MAG: helix-turn-helix transcriptional regulator [Bradyrhizobium sp.]|nr:helix-turn-helix transcriptional regulator [Bradyrhizobium sp.]